MGILKLAAAAALAVAASAGANAANLVTNGGFEDGFANWNSNGWFTADSYGGVSSYEGTTHASTGCVNQFCTLSQDLTTVAGGRYDVSFAFNPGLGVEFGGGQTDVYFGSTLLTSLVGGTNEYTLYNFSNVLATSGTTTLTFAGYQNPAWNGVDSVSVEASGAVPEPASWALMLGGFGAIGGAMRSRRKMAVSFN